MPRYCAAITLLAVTCLFSPGCSLLRSISGTEVDAERFASSREARSLELRLEKAMALASYLEKNDPYDEGAMTIQLSSSFLNHIAQWYKGKRGMLDKNTQYSVDSISVALQHGSATATLGLVATHDSYGVELHLLMDCRVLIEKAGDKLKFILEPYNIRPDVESTGFLVGSSTMIENIVKMKLSKLNDDFPPLMIPIEFDDSMELDNQRFSIREQINMDVSIPRRVLDYRFSINEILITREAVFAIINLDEVNVR
jgi:hypothetical protein